MSGYTGNAEAIRALVRDAAVHRDVFIDDELFKLEMEHLFANTWVFVGHDSQIPNEGDYYTTTIGTQPVIMVRHGDGLVKVLHNRCPHKGVKVTAEPCGNTGKVFRCPYHAWRFRTDGTLLSLPQQKGYDDTGFDKSPAALGLPPVRHVRNYRGFVFAKLNDAGLGFEDFFGESLSSFDNMIDRSPAGKLEVAGGVLRYMHNCNWKMLVDNQTDTCHPMVAHESSAGTTKNIWNTVPEGTAKPMAVEIFLPFMSAYEDFDKMGIRVWENGHGHTGVHRSIHSDYTQAAGYFDQMKAAYGEERARDILGEARHNTVYFPNIMIKGPIQLLRCSSRSRPTRRWSNPGRSASSARRTCCSSARSCTIDSSTRRPRSSATTIWKCTSARRKACAPTATNGWTCIACTTRPKSRRRTSSRSARTNGSCATPTAPGPSS